MTDEQIEAVADAICLAANGCKLSELDEVWRRDIMRRYARAAVAALQLTPEANDFDLAGKRLQEALAVPHSMQRWVSPWREVNP